LAPAPGQARALAAWPTFADELDLEGGAFIAASISPSRAGQRTAQVTPPMAEVLAPPKVAKTLKTAGAV
jgi:hypothetical protein